MIISTRKPQLNLTMDSTRIDKYLWAIRLFKTRTEATEACKGGRVTIAGASVKPSKEVRPGEVITVRKGAVRFSYRMKAPLEKRVGAALVEQYAEDVTPESERIKMHAPVETVAVIRDRGTGRPTKRDRRKMDELIDLLQLPEDFD